MGLSRWTRSQQLLCSNYALILLCFVCMWNRKIKEAIIISKTNQNLMTSTSATDFLQKNTLQHSVWNSPAKENTMVDSFYMLLSLTLLNSPYPVWDTSSAAPPMGLVKTPTMPFPTPEMTPLALLPAELCISQFLWKFCMGWSTMPAIAPKTTRNGCCSLLLCFVKYGMRHLQLQHPRQTQY